MLKNSQISKFRSEVIEKTINVEWLMNSIICQHYFGKVIFPFTLEVLYDEYFSFALKRRIIEKIVEDFDKKRLQDLNRLNTIRNYFAHCNQEIFLGPEIPPEGAKGQVIDPRKTDRAIDFEKLYEEFTQIIGEIETYLATVYVEKGGELLAADKNQEKPIEKNMDISMSDSQKAKIYKHLQKAGVRNLCPACDQDVEWKQANIVTVLGMTDSSPDASRAIPLIPAICKNCGYVRFFSAKSIGLF